MADTMHVPVPRENVNDEVVILVKWHVQPGDRVSAGQVLAEIETSKTVLEVEAPRPGFVHHWHPAGGEIAVGDTLCVIADDVAATRGARPPAAAPLPAAAPVPTTTAATPSATLLESTTRPVNRSVRLSAAAAAYAQAHDIDPVGLAGRGLVRACDLAGFARTPRAGLPAEETQRAERPPQPSSGVATARLVPGVPTTRELLPRRKAMEIRTLSGGAAGALPSWVSIACPTRGLRRLAAGRQEIHGNATALVLFEVARLLRQFPIFNAAYDDGAISFYQEVNVGFAVDAGRGLKVPVIHHADTKPLATIGLEMQQAVYDYMEDALPLESLARGTFCVSDLSGEEVTSFQPLVSEGQAAILGIGGECFPAPAAVGSYSLILAFDHRIAEGRVAGQFLRALRDRLTAHEAALASGQEDAGHADAMRAATCTRCGRGTAELTSLDGFLIASAHPRGYLCSICLGGF